MDALVEDAQRRGARLAVDAPVDRIVVEDGRVVGVERDGVLERADLVIATTPSMIFRRLVPGLAEIGPVYDELLQRVHYQWATVLMLALDRPLSDIYWLDHDGRRLPVRGSGRADRTSRHLSATAASTSSTSRTTRTPAIRSLTPRSRRFSIATSRTSGASTRTSNRSWIQGQWLAKDRAGQPIVDAQYHESIPPHRTPIEGLWLANTTQIYPEDRGQNYSIRMGRRVARIAVLDAVPEAEAAGS